MESSLGLHKNDANVFRAVQTEGGIKFQKDKRLYYSDGGYETASLTAYDNSIVREKRASDNHEKAEALRTLIGDIKRDLTGCGILERLELEKLLADAERRLRRLVSFDLNANLKAVSRLVALSNFDKLRPYQAKQLERAEKEYANAMRLANLCPHCFLPIKVEKRQVVEVIATSKTRAYSNHVLDYIASETWKQLKTDGVQKRKLRFRHVRVSTLETAVVITHYQHFKYTDANGKVKLFYGLVDGTRRNGKLLPMKVTTGKFGQAEYYTIPDLIKLEGTASESYTLRDIKCGCSK